MSLLAVSNLTKVFGETTVIRRVDLEIAPGERHAIIGSNGAGKSTLFHVISGRLRPTSGSIMFQGRNIDGLSPQEIVRMGLARSFQITNIFPRLTVFENIRLGVSARRFGHARRSEVSVSRIRRQTMSIAEDVGLAEVTERIAGTLSYGDQRRLEIGLALAVDPQLILLDEPTAGMSLAASGEIVNLLERIPRDITLLLIEHDLDLALRLSDRLTVMHQGEVLAQGAPTVVVADKRVQQAYLGGGSIAVPGVSP